MKKFFLIIGILFLALLAAAEFTVRSEAFGERIRPFIAGPLRDILGADARIGHVRANFLPPYLEVRDVTVPDAQGRETLYVRKATVYLNPVPLLLKKIRLPSITLLQPRIYAERAADGTSNILPLAERIKENLAGARGAPSGYRVLLRTITVRNGEIRLADAATDSRLAITGLNLSARINVAGDRVGVKIRPAPVRLATPAHPAITGFLKASAEYDRGRLRLDFIELKADDAWASVSGDVSPLPDAVLDLKGRIVSGPRMLGKLAAFLKAAPKQKGPRFEASVSVKGALRQPLIDGRLKHSGLFFRGVALADSVLSFRYEGGQLVLGGENWRVAREGKVLALERVKATLGYKKGVLELGDAEITAGDLAVRMQGVVDPESGLNVSLSAESSGEGRTLSSLTLGQLSGRAALGGRLSGDPAAPFFDGTLNAGPLTARKIRFDDVHGRVTYGHGKIALTTVDIRRGSSRYRLDGSLDLRGPEPVYSARLGVIQSDVVSIVAMFYKPLPLILSASGELTFRGTAHDYSGSGRLSLEAGSAYGETFTRGELVASLTTGRISFPRVAAYKKKGTVSATGWIGFDGAYAADLECRDLELAAVDRLAELPLDGLLSLNLHSSGTFTMPAAQASLEVEDLGVRGARLGRLRASAGLRDAQLELNAGLLEDAARLSAHWQLRAPYAWTAEAKIRTGAVNPLSLLGNKGLADRVNLIADGAVTARGEGLALSSLRGEAVFQRIGLVIGEYRIDNESDAVFDLEGGGISVRSLRFSGPGTKLSISGSARIPGRVDLTVNGAANLPLLKLFFREVEHAAGTVDMKLTVRDDWSNPEAAGELRLRGGEIKMKDIPQKFTALNGTFSFAQGRIVTESLTGEMGGGTLGVSGWVQLSGFALRAFSVKTSVDNVTVRYPEGLISTLSGDLYYDGDPAEQTLSGDVVVKRARYDKRIEWKSMLVDLGRGLYQKKKTDIGWIGNTLVNVRFHGADNILFQNNLANVPLEVDLFLRGTVNHPQLLGRIEARKGSVYLRKNDFRILYAAIDFVDPNRMNPVLDIQAETQVREYQIRLAVTGTAERASVTFISDPALNDTDILSLLALGKKGSELIGKETTVGVGEAASFATGQFQDIFERRARSLTGLDRFQVDPYVGQSDTSVPRVTVGKEVVQNKLFVTYSSNVGAAIPEQVFRVEYILNKHFSLVGERNELGNTGGDIKYRFEFD
jgi:hypothetical protein